MGQHLGKITGDIRVLLEGERTALNYLQRMSGIATYTHSIAVLFEGSKTSAEWEVEKEEWVRSSG